MISTVGLVYLAVALTIPTLPIQVTSQLHGSTSDVGWVMGSYAITAVLARPVFGALLIRIGARPIVAGGALVVALATLGYLAAPNVAILITCRLILGIGLGGVLAAATIWMVSLVPPSKQGWALGLVGTVNYLVLAVGAPIGEAMAEATRPTVVGLAAGIFPLLSLLLLFTVPDHRQPQEDRTEEHRSGPRTSATRAAVLPGVSLTMAAFGYAAVISFSAVALAHHGVADGALVVTAYAATMVVIRVAGARSPWNFTSPQGLIAIFLAEAVGIFLIGTSDSLLSAVVGGVLVGAGMSQVYPALGLLVMRSVDAQRKGQAVATYGAFMNIGISVGNFALGYVANTAGYSAMFVTATATILCGLVVAVLAATRREEG
ncbi:MFS transporter [Streptomyces sp. CT34]|uniref:MFS transporter n=1 Tax=Streptomyces sp. CT34 TaxID=1553907 RepID=UPI0005B9C7E6|nr:MFS transporter [Streptomyces sp. CT34]